MIFKLATKLLSFLVTALQAEARRSVKRAQEFNSDITKVEARRDVLVAQANRHAAIVTYELAQSRQEYNQQAVQATALAANLRLLTSLDPRTIFTDSEE